MLLTPPFTTADYLAAASTAFALPMNAVQERDKPRASSLGACAREQAAMMAGLIHDPIGTDGSARSTDGDLTAEQGRMFEDVSVKIIDVLPQGIRVVDRQIELPADYPVTGHPDGALEFWYDNSFVAGGSANIDLGWSPTDKDGIRWGFEHKHLGRWAYEKILKVGLYKAEPGYYLQGALYADALGWDASLYVIIAQDGSSIRGDMTANLRAKNPATRWAYDPTINPKVNILPVDMRPAKNGLVPMAINRALWLQGWKEQDGDPSHVAREYKPTEMKSKWVPDGEGGRMEVMRPDFPCSYCPVLAQCLEWGDGGERAPALPWTLGDEDTGD